MTRTNATLAFLYSPDLQHVLLMQKQRPEMHKGLFNGLGGKLERGETDRACATREVLEEAGILVSEAGWTAIGTLEFEAWNVSIWVATVSEADLQKSSFPEPGLAWFVVGKLPSAIVSNLHWLVPLGIDILKKRKSKESAPFVRATYLH